MRNERAWRDPSRVTAAGASRPVTTSEQAGSATARRILVVTPDILPVEGCATTGAGLRAWGLGQGLRSRGHDVTFAMPKAVADSCGYRGREVGLYDEVELDAFVRDLDPDVVLFQHWPMVGLLSDAHRGFVVIDFHGPLLLETQFRDPAVVERLVDVKLRALARADFFVCAGERQRYYYLAHLLLAGFDLRRAPIAVVPFSLSPDQPARVDAGEDARFVYGGVFLPWQDPGSGLRILVDELERAGRGELHVFGGEHPWMNLALDERLGELRASLSRSRSVEVHPRVSRDELIESYTRASVAWDLMAPNAERELAFTSRTVEYLWCGLPVVHNDYAELSEPIAEYDAGWTVDPADDESIREIVRSIVADPAAAARKSANASRLVRERLSWDVTIDPLDAYCRAPRRAERTAPGPIAVGGSVVDGLASIRGNEQLAVELVAFVDRARRVVPRTLRRALRRLVAGRQR
jgi:glycosyltransferase involved in cell wall biosynthesis